MDGERVKRTIECRIEMNIKERVIHVNRLRPLLRPDTTNEHSEGQWSPPLFQYYCDDHPAPDPQAAPQSGQPVTTRSGRVVRPVDYYDHIHTHFFMHMHNTDCKCLF